MPSTPRLNVKVALPILGKAMTLLGFWTILLGAILRVAVGPEIFDFSSPLTYVGDGISHSFVIKSVMETGWFPSYNRFVGAPFVAAHFDYPGNDVIHYLLIKLIAQFSDDWAIVQNVYVLIGFVLCAFSAHLVLRYLGIHEALAVAGAALFTMLPFHFLRTQHLFLAAYFCVPVAIWLALEAGRLGREPTAIMAGREWALLLAVGAFIGACGVYYAFFASVLLLAAGAAAWLATRSVRAAVISGALALAVAATVLLSSAPSLVYRLSNGANAEATNRHPRESEAYGLTLTQLIFPRPSHRWKPARIFSARYHTETPSNFEKRASSIGLVGTAGLLVLAFAVFGRLAGTSKEVTMLDRLSLLALVCFAVATVGGLGAVFAWTVSPMIRGYARMSVFIGFLGIAALMFGLQAVLGRLARHPVAMNRSAIAIASIVGVVGILDQTVFGEFARGATKLQFLSDRAFVSKAEQALTPGAQIYQLPYHAYPESGTVNQMGDYDLFRGYLHSKALRWSYGSMKGRAGDLWHRSLAEHSLPAQLDVARASGFSAVYVDRGGHSDGGVAIEAILRGELGAPILVSDDRNLAMYKLAGPSRPVPASDDVIPAVTDLIDLSASKLSQLALSGFGAAEPWGRWTTGPVATLVFLRPLPARFAVDVELVTAFGLNLGRQIEIRVGDEQQAFAAEGLPKWVHAEFKPTEVAHVVSLVIPRPTSPMSLRMGTDDRLLGLGIKRLQIVRLD